MANNPSNPQLQLPLVREEFWRVAICAFDGAFRNWLMGRISDDDMLQACAKFDYAVLQTRIENHAAVPADPLNGASLGEERRIAAKRWCRLDSAIRKLRDSRGEPCTQYRGDSVDVVRRQAYWDRLEGTSFADPQFNRVVTFG